MILRHERLGLSAAFAAVTLLFFAWGFIASNNDPLIVAMRLGFGLSYGEALRIQLVSFLANGLVSFPAAALGNRIGATRAVLLALITMASGSLAVVAALGTSSFAAVLCALFVQASGITMLQVAANPLAAALGPAGSSHFRLTVAQTFNSLGVVVGVNFGAAAMLGDLGRRTMPIGDALGRQSLLHDVQSAFAVMTAMTILMTIAVLSQRRRIAAQEPDPAESRAEAFFGALKSGWARCGAIAIALYVGAEVSIGSIMIAFLHEPGIMGLPFEQGGLMLANVYWGGALAGRFAGSLLLTRVSAWRLLALCAAAAAALCALAFAGLGAVSGWSALAVGLFNSIMFPTIFSITLIRSSASPTSTSGLLVLAISFGAIVPFLVSLLADAHGIGSAFTVPVVAYGLILGFALLNGATQNALRHEQ